MASLDPHPRTTRAMRVLASLCVMLALICAGLAFAWRHERETSACWRTAAMFGTAAVATCDP